MKLTSYQVLVQSAAIHPSWDAEDHAMYLWSEVYGGSAEGSFEDLVCWCQNWLSSDRLADDVAAVLAYADAWNNA